MSKSLRFGILAVACVAATALAASPSFAKDLKFPDYDAHAQDGGRSRFDTGRSPWDIAGGLSFGVEGGVWGSHANFGGINPPFDNDGTDGTFGAFLEYMFGIPNTRTRIGPRVGGLFPFGCNDIVNPAASPGATYSVCPSATAYYEGVLKFDAQGFRPNMRIRPRFQVFLGAATTSTQVKGFGQGFAVDTANSVTGWTVGAGMEFPLNDWATATARLRYIDAPTTTYFLPGPVRIGGHAFIGTVGVEFDLARFLAPTGIGF